MAASESRQTWDYVVVGGGSAGCVLANRLTEDPRVTVLLLEAGGEANGFAVKMPALIQKLGGDLNWLYPAAPDPSRHGIVVPYSSGRGLGGSSSINNMMWVRGNPGDYDAWAAAGCEGWDYDGVLPYFRRAERFEDGASRYRGGTGPQRVGRMRISHPLVDRFRAGAVEAGCPSRGDYNAGEQEGAAVVQVNQRRGLRHSAADAYLAPVRGRGNLTVETDAAASRILLEGTRAVGVEYRSAGRTRLARASREVVLSAGAIASPKILMQSGIGPEASLSQHGIAVVTDLPGVGRNLQDHAATALVFEVTLRTLNQDVTPLRLARHGVDFLLRGRGALTATANHAVVFASSPASRVPDLELIFVAYGLVAASDQRRQDAGARLNRLTARTGGRSDGRRQAAHEPLVTVTAVTLHPRARGEVRLASGDPDEPPVVHHELLGDPADVGALQQAGELVRKIFATRALAPYVVAERLPGAHVSAARSWEEHLRENAFRLHHPTSTCAMGTGPEAVVDPRLRVRGIASLRVIDASVMPTIPSGNTNAPTIMIGEKGSDLVRADYD